MGTAAPKKLSDWGLITEKMTGGRTAFFLMLQFFRNGGHKYETIVLLLEWLVDVKHVTEAVPQTGSNQDVSKCAFRGHTHVSAFRYGHTHCHLVGRIVALSMHKKKVPSGPRKTGGRETPI